MNRSKTPVKRSWQDAFSQKGKQSIGDEDMEEEDSCDDLVLEDLLEEHSALLKELLGLCQKLSGDISSLTQRLTTSLTQTSHSSLLNPQ